MSEEENPKQGEGERANYLLTTELHKLQTAVYWLCMGFGWRVYLVGSCLKKRDFRDVDLRCILLEEEEDIFQHPKSTVIQIALSEYLSNMTGLPIDFQFQTQKEADRYDGQRICLGQSL